MPIRFTVLASGSAGNASLIQAGRFGLLLDVGLGPRQLAARLTASGLSWANVDAVLLTHTHSDHWNDRTLAHLRRRRIQLYCHAEHGKGLRRFGTEFASLDSDRLVHNYDGRQEWTIAPGLRCRPLELSHDGGPTFGFRFESEADEIDGSSVSLAYAADLGTWTPALARALADVNLLALEFNHDVGMQHASGRSFHLIRRILGDRGHLSNIQAAALLQETLRQSAPGRLRHLVQLHLSRDCNLPELARTAARAALGDAALDVHTASQDVPVPTILISPPTVNGTAHIRPTRRARDIAARPSERWLPGFGPESEPEASAS
jgi:phosphoribosyl 1,2-cyclic phosphodiesterase